jgi:iron complex outermembrane receptor protein
MTIATFGGGVLLDIDPYTLFDLRAGVQTNDGRWRLEVWGRNITNKYYWTQANNEADTITRTAGFPATYGVTLRFRY